MNNKNILQEIKDYKLKEVSERKMLYPTKFLENKVYFPTQPVSLSKYILDPQKSGIIAEFKTRSPSKGTINSYAEAGEISLSYMQAGAAALSILTDSYYFGGSLENLKRARQENYCPILQKDFIVDEYQILEAKAYGADAILLIASVLSKQQVRNFSELATSLGLEVVFEIHDLHELDNIYTSISIIGINNRNLKNFTVDFSNSLKLSKKISEKYLKIAESGINSPKNAKMLLDNGFHGLLIGEEFMKHLHPGNACKKFIDHLRVLRENNK